MIQNIQKQTAINQIVNLMKCVPLDDEGKKISLYDLFNDPLTTDLMCNPDGKVYVDKMGKGMYCVGSVDPEIVKQIISAVAGFHDIICNAEHPICESEFPVDGSRFEGVIPTIVSNPSFDLRKKATRIFSLDNYIDAGTITPTQRKVISDAVVNKKNILIVGGTGSGKTTLINAVIKEMEELCPADRILIIEDTGEIQCASKNKIQLHTDPINHIYMTDLLKVALRERPDRILVGEVRGPEALDLLDAWNTGHSGGLATLHSNSAISALDRLKGLVTRNKYHPDDIDKIIGETVNYIIHIARVPGGRKLKDIIQIDYFNTDTKKYEFHKVM